MKLRNEDGTIAWTTLLDGSDHLDDRGWAIDVGADGCPIITGILSRTDGNADFYTAKLRATDGGVIWSRTVAGAVNNLNERAGWVEVVANGDAIMCNRTWTAQTSYDVIAQRYRASDGGDVWTARYGSGPSIGDNPRAMTLASSGDVLVAGVCGGNYQVLRLDGSTGELDWAAGYDGPAHGYDMANCIIEGPGGSVIASGFATGAATSWDAVTVGLDGATGSFLWDEGYDTGDCQVEEGSAMAVAAGGDLYVVGYAYTWSNDNDVMILHYELTDPAAAPEGVPRDDLVAVRPNPVRGRAEIRFAPDLTRDAPARVRIVDAAGRIAWERTLEPGSTSIVWNGEDGLGRPCPAGVYILRLASDAGPRAERRIVRVR